MSGKIVDERIIAAKRKIQSDGFQILWYVLILSTFVQQFFMRAPFSQFACEFFCWIGCSIYILVRNYQMGIDMGSTSGKSALLGAVLSGVLAVIVMMVLTGEDKTNNLIIFFVCFVIFNFLAKIIMSYLNRKKQKQIDASLGDDEMSM